MSDNKGFSVLAFRWVVIMTSLLVLSKAWRSDFMVSLRPKKSDVSTDGNKTKLRRGIRGKIFLRGEGVFLG
jgi:hypothetical protein